MNTRGLWIPVLLSLIATGCQPGGGREVTLAVGRDPAGQHQILIEEFQRQNPGIKVKLLEMPESSTTQRDAYVTYLVGRDHSIDVYSIDIIWPAEFAEAQWLIPLDEYLTAEDLADFLPGPLYGCRWKGKLYALPWFTDAGLLYYRKDILERKKIKVPTTWEGLIKIASFLAKEEGLAGYIWQGQQYEGLVCNFLEVLWSCGGDVFDSGGRPSLDSPAALRAMNIMIEMLNTNASPRGVLTYKEEEARQLFTSGQAVFMRNWPYAWSLAQDSSQGSKVAKRTGIAPLPSGDGKTSAACLGGWNLGISRFSKHKAEAVALVKFLCSAQAQKTFSLRAGRLPTRASLYKDQEVLKAYPHYSQLYQAFIGARPRPALPNYSQISDILQLGLHRILTERIGPEAGLAEIQKGLLNIVAKPND